MRQLLTATKHPLSFKNQDTEVTLSSSPDLKLWAVFAKCLQWFNRLIYTVICLIFLNQSFYIPDGRKGDPNMQCNTVLMTTVFDVIGM